MLLTGWTSASGHYGMTTTVTTEYGAGVDKENDVVYAYTPDKLALTTCIVDTGDNSLTYIDPTYAIKIPNGDSVAFFTFDTIHNIQFALCSYSNDPGDGNGWRNEFVYILASAIDYTKIAQMFPDLVTPFSRNKPLLTLNVPYIPDESANTNDGSEEESENDQIIYKLNKEYLSRPFYTNEYTNFEHQGEAWICTSDEITWVLDSQQVLFNSCDQLRDSTATIINNEKFYDEAIGKYTIVSGVTQYVGTGSPIIEVIGPGNVEYLLITYNGKPRYVKRDNFQRYDGSKPILKIFEEQTSLGENVKITSSTVQLLKEACMLDSDQVLKWKGSHQANVDADNYWGLLSKSTKIEVCAYEIINNAKFLIRKCGGLKNYYIPINAIEEISEDYSDQMHEDDMSPIVVPTPDRQPELADRDSILYDPEQNVEEDEWDPGNIGDNNPLDNYGANLIGSIKETQKSTETNENVDHDNYRWYEITLPIGQWPDDDMNELTGAADLYQRADRLLPNEYGFYDWDSPNASLYYSLQMYHPENLSKKKGYTADKRQISRINRFKYITNKSGLSTKSFIFMTKPDLNLYKTNNDGTVERGTLNSDLALLPEFVYIARNSDIGIDILDSLEYFGTDSGNTPWLSIITNQAEGYSPIDREIGYTEVGETFHGHKVLYGKHDFKHNVAGTVTIPFSERRDLSLYYTLKVWTEYIHCINMGLVEPRDIHMVNRELDYAVSLYYIQTDETMENIVYWEKLTGVFPLKCPDSFFAWNKGEPGKNMEYDIEFAYSMRSVLRSWDLLELNRLYKKNIANDESTEYYKAPDGTYTDEVMDLISNRYISRLAAYFHLTRWVDQETKLPVTDEFGQDVYRPAWGLNERTDVHSDEYQEFVDQLLENPDDLSYYFYEPYYPEIGKVSAAEFLSNYSVFLQSPGIPYVTGPFIAPGKELNAGRYLLKWV